MKKLIPIAFLFFFFLENRGFCDLEEDSAIKQINQLPLKPSKEQKIKDEQKPAEEIKTLRPTQKSGSKESQVEPSFEPVFFEANGLFGEKEKGFLELKQNVKINQADMSLSSDQGKIFFDPISKEVKSVLTQGKVLFKKIDLKTKEDIKAMSDQAEFDAGQQIITLKGNASLTKGKDTIKGAVIVYELKTGLIRAEKIQGTLEPSKRKQKEESK